MLNTGILEIAQLNNEFYSKNAESFDKSREFYWKGFENSLKYLKSGMQILDLGCGNARFLKFLSENKISINYLGVDSNDSFIESNKKKFPNDNFLKVDFINTEKVILDHQFDAVVGFGITHHIPSKDFRKIWFRNLGELVSQNGYLILSFWNFDKSKDDTQFKTNFYRKENGDYFLGWKGDYSQHRYCHEYDQEELNEIKKIYSNFEVIEEFDKEDNKYIIFHKK